MASNESPYAPQSEAAAGPVLESHERHSSADEAAETVEHHVMHKQASTASLSASSTSDRGGSMGSPPVPVRSHSRGTAQIEGGPSSDHTSREKRYPSSSHGLGSPSAGHSSIHESLPGDIRVGTAIPSDQPPPYTDELRASSQAGLPTTSDDHTTNNHPEESLPSFDWTDLELRYTAMIKQKDEDFDRVWQDYCHLQDFFGVWSGMVVARETDRTSKRLKTQEYYVRAQEVDVERQRTRFVSVMEAFSTRDHALHRSLTQRHEYELRDMIDEFYDQDECVRDMTIPKVNTFSRWQDSDLSRCIIC